MVYHNVSLCDGIALRLVSASLHYDKVDFVEFVAVFWTIVQFSFIAIMTIAFVFTQRLTLFIILIMGYTASGLNEWVIKHLSDELRPQGWDGSCIPTNGFPSGHAVVSMSYLAWILLEAINRPSWTIRKRIAIAFFLSGILVPVGPLRSVVHDHSWKQIGVGMGIGLVWGTLFWLLTRFVIVPHLYRIMHWKIVQFFHIRNDLRPYFEQSKDEGKKVTKHEYNNKYYKYLDTKRWRRDNYRDPFIIAILHGIVILVGFILAGLGIGLGLWKRHQTGDSQCDATADELMISAGTLLGVTFVFFLPVPFLLHRKLKNEEWHPEVVQCLMFVVGFFFCQASFFAWCVYYGATDGVEHDHRHCTSGANLGIVYLVLYFVVCGIMAGVIIVCYFLLDLRRLYGFKSRKPSQVEEINRGGTIEEALKSFEEKSDGTPATSTISSPTSSSMSSTSTPSETELCTQPAPAS